MSLKIECLEDVLGATIRTHTIKKFPDPIENFTSVIVAVSVKTENEELEIVGKLLPANPIVWKFSNIESSFKEELYFYKTLVPTLEEFDLIKEHSLLEFLPRFYGGRLNLQNDNSAGLDQHGVILLENLSFSRFKTANRLECFDLESAAFILENLACFHAAFIGFKLQNPQLFEDKIKLTLPKVIYNGGTTKAKILIRNMLSHLEKLSVGNSLYARAEKVLKTVPTDLEPKEPFATISHNDLWTNNILLKYKNGHPVNVKFVDFQNYTYGSPAKDIIFFLFTSVKNQVLEQHFDYLIATYYARFISVLKLLQCETEIFQLEDFKSELDFVARNTEFHNIMFALSGVFATKESIPHVEQMNSEFLNAVSKIANKELLAKLEFLVREFAKRSWI